MDTVARVERERSFLCRFHIGRAWVGVVGVRGPTDQWRPRRFDVSLSASINPWPSMTRIAVALAVIGLALLPPSRILAQRGGASAADSIKYKYPGSPKLE